MRCSVGGNEHSKTELGIIREVHKNTCRIGMSKSSSGCRKDGGRTDPQSR